MIVPQYVQGKENATNSTKHGKQTYELYDLANKHGKQTASSGWCTVYNTKVAQLCFLVELGLQT